MAPSLVQSVPATGTASPLSVTLSSTTAGNCLIVCFSGTAGSANPSVTGITLGGASGNFAQQVTAGNPAADQVTTSQWADPACAGGQTAISITFTGSGSGLAACAIVMEWSGLVTSTPLDQSASQVNNSGSASWSSTATPTTTQASEVAIGCVGANFVSGTVTITGPGGAWTNLTQETSGGGHNGLLVGYQVLSSTGTVTYSGTNGGSYFYSAIAATYKAAAAAADNSPYLIAQNTGFF